MKVRWPASLQTSKVETVHEILLILTSTQHYKQHNEGQLSKLFNYQKCKHDDSFQCLPKLQVVKKLDYHFLAQDAISALAWSFIVTPFLTVLTVETSAYLEIAGQDPCSTANPSDLHTRHLVKSACSEYASWTDHISYMCKAFNNHHAICLSLPCHLSQNTKRLN